MSYRIYEITQGAVDAEGCWGLTVVAVTVTTVLAGTLGVLAQKVVARSKA